MDRRFDPTDLSGYCNVNQEVLSQLHESCRYFCSSISLLRSKKFQFQGVWDCGCPKLMNGDDDDIDELLLLSALLELQCLQYHINIVFNCYKWCIFSQEDGCPNLSFQCTN